MQAPSTTPEKQVTAVAVGSGVWLGDWPRTGKVIARFSCGAASAVATKLAIEKYGAAVEIYYTDTGSEHPDNVRFLHDCEKWFGQKVRVLKSDRYADTWAVFEGKRFLVSNKGAPCTAELKRKPGDTVWEIGDVEIFGYTVEERKRVRNFGENNPERIIECPLIDRELTKEDCLGMLERVGIEMPAMYRLGFRNNNCIACVKARDNLDYWKRVRKHFPAQFARMAKLERELKMYINRVTRDGVRSPIYLDEIEAGDPKGADPQIACGLFCMAEADGFSSPNMLLGRSVDDKKTE
jgi:3'-phosphoadenosine 5'-phosphosulfate sulfotransferase (PAPS reductase)/FAD synthetase